MSDDAMTPGKAAMVYFLRKDGSESAAVMEPDADGGYTWTVPEGIEAITGWTLPGGRETGMRGGGGAVGYAVPADTAGQAPPCG